MRNFLVGVVVGALGMGYYTGYLKVSVDGQPLKDVVKETTS